MAAKKNTRRRKPAAKRRPAAAPRRRVRRRTGAAQSKALAPRRRSGPSPALAAAQGEVEKQKKAKNAALTRAREAEDAMPVLEHVVAAPAAFGAGLGVQKFVAGRVKKNAEKVAAGTALTKTDERLANPELIGSGLAALASAAGILGHKFMPRGAARKAFAGATLGASAGAMGAVGFHYSARKEAEKAAASGADPATNGPAVFQAADQLLAQMRGNLPPPAPNSRGTGPVVVPPAANRRAF